MSQYIMNALLLGGIYGLIGVGFSLVYGIMNVINLAHGSFIMIGGYITYWLFATFQIDPFLSVPIAGLIAFILGYYLQKFIINPSMRSGVLMSMILTYGIALVFVNVVLVVWGANFRTVSTSYAGKGFELLGAVIPYTRLGILGLALLLTFLLYLFMSRTKTGLAIQAAALNRDAAQLTGVNVAWIQCITYGISSALAAAAGSMLGAVYVVTPNMWGEYLGRAFVVAVLGGLGNMWGAMLGGLVLALVESIGVSYLGATWQNAIAFTLFVVILVLRPYGLVGKRFYAEI